MSDGISIILFAFTGGRNVRDIMNADAINNAVESLGLIDPLGL
jgi:hypothetical protein